MPLTLSGRAVGMLPALWSPQKRPGLLGKCSFGHAGYTLYLLAEAACSCLSLLHSKLE